MKLPALTPRMVTVFTWIAVFAALAPAIMFAAAPTIIWLEDNASGLEPGTGAWLLRLAASMLALAGMIAISIWAWPLALIFLSVRLIRILQWRLPHATDRNTDKRSS